MQRITHNTAESFYLTIANLVQSGLTFEADGDTWTVTLTGGF